VAKIPEQIGPYRPLEEIGRGGMSIVYATTDNRNGRRVALKVLPPEFAHNPTFLNRFVKEGESAVRLRHPNIVHTFEAGKVGESHYIAMELAQAGTLSERMKAAQGMLPEAMVVDILRQAAAGLDFAHSLGMVHRDIKPSNIMFAGDGRAMIADFGVAKELTSDFTQVTMPGFSVGTPAYMSPEQARGDLDLDRRADIYSLGVVAYALLTGKMPFEAPSQLVLLRKIVDEMPRPAEEINPNIHPGAAYVLGHVLAKDPNARYKSCREFAEQLAHALSQPRWESAGGLDATVAMIPITPGSKPPSHKSTPPPAYQPSQRATPPPPYYSPSASANQPATAESGQKKANRLPILLVGVVGALVIAVATGSIFLPGLFPFLSNGATTTQELITPPVTTSGNASELTIETTIPQTSSDTSATNTNASASMSQPDAVNIERRSQLSEPAIQVLLNGEETTFIWLSEESLPQNQALELVFWPAQLGTDGWTNGIAPDGLRRSGSGGRWQADVDVLTLARIYGDDFVPGEYLWGIVRVEVQPVYQRIGLESEARPFTYQPAEGSADNGARNNNEVATGVCAGALCGGR